MFQKNFISLKSFLIILKIIFLFNSTILLACNFYNKNTIIQNLKYPQKLNSLNHHQNLFINHLQSVFNYTDIKKISNYKIIEYQQIIDNFETTIIKSQKKYNNINDNYFFNTNQNLSVHKLKKKISHINDQLENLLKQLKKEENQIHAIYKSFTSLPQQQNNIKNSLNHLKQQPILYTKIYDTPLINHTKFIDIQIPLEFNPSKKNLLEFTQLSSNNQQELFKLQIQLLKKKYNFINNQLQILLNKLHHSNYHKINQSIIYTEKNLLKQNDTLPKSIKNQLKINHELLLNLNQQTHHFNDIILKKKKIEIYIIQAQQTLNNLIEQSEWVNKSPALGETLRTQVSNLPKIPKFQQLDSNIAQLRAKRLQYENHIHQLPILFNQIKQDNEIILTPIQQHILQKQLNIQKELIILLTNSYNTQILELTKLKLSYGKLKNILKEIQQATHRYLFWVADIRPISILYPLEIYQDIFTIIFNYKLHNQIISVLRTIISNLSKSMLTLLCIITLIGLHFSIRPHFYNFLKKSSKQVGKVNQDNFLITFYNICGSMIMALPIPILWIIIGYNLSNTWIYPSITSIGDGMQTTAFILWGSITNRYFASPTGLFIIHFGWPKNKIQKIFSKNYSWSIIIIILLTMALTIFNNYNNREFSNTLGRLCFILLCFYLSFITNHLKRSGLPLYLNKYDTFNNIINHFLWNIMLFAPIIAAIACTFGYLFTAQELLIRLEKSLFIWILLLTIYYTIRRWMFIQRRRIAFKRAKKKRTTQLNLRFNSTFNYPQKSAQNAQLTADENNKKTLDLDTMSTQSLQLIRSIITLIALLLMTILWSDLQVAFYFLKNITLWDVTSTIKGVENIQPITLHALLIIIVVILITTITVRNLPAFLELTLLQYLHLNPGTGYAITTLTKYILMLLGGLMGFSLIGIEWVKIQWLIAALGVGLGFGLQEIFANFISGLIILFEKPIRIGDTITIQNFTGNVTRINTRATIITDWNHKEIIVPNKEFITKQFINWSLSNSITRVILKIPAPLKIDITEMTNILMKIIQKSPLALNKPAPEVYLINLNQGLPIFEIRIYTADIKSRIPLCHQINTGIMKYYKKNGLELPCIPIHFYKEPNFNSNNTPPSDFNFVQSTHTKDN